MGATTHSLEVNAPVGAVYGQWTQFEEFPRFMEGVVEVQRHDAKRLLWKVNIGGKDKEWEAEILEQIPDARIVWESVDGTQNRGIIAFEPLDLDRTLITLTMEYEPEGFLEKAGDALGIPSSQVEGNLKRFRDFIERREMENGTWDGQGDEGVINGDRTGVIESRPLSPIPARTEEIVAPTEEEEEIKNPEPVGHSSLLSAKSATGSFPEEASLPPLPRDGQGHSEFYRDAGVLSPTHEKIAERAYELYLARGSVHGYEHEDWLEAEKQLTELPARDTETPGI
jgi:Polyketide cyclase / dehydrase and lipid transport/Protein of unknown function (DUF2934)